MCALHGSSSCDVICKRAYTGLFSKPLYHVQILEIQWKRRWIYIQRHWFPEVLSNDNPFGCYPRDAMLAQVIAIATCLSVCLSVTRRYCVKTKKASIMISSPSGSPKTLVFWRQISSPNSKGGLKQGSVGKIQRFSSFKRQYLENGSRYGKSYY